MLYQLSYHGIKLEPAEGLEPSCLSRQITDLLVSPLTDNGIKWRNYATVTLNFAVMNYDGFHFVPCSMRGGTIQALTRLSSTLRNLKHRSRTDPVPEIGAGKEN